MAPMATTSVPQSSSIDSPKPPNPSHSRTYQACIPCRRRKVRCDLGPVDNPHEPPCVRCRRESKECYFSATRRKRKFGSDDAEGFRDDVDEAFVARNARRPASYTTASPETQKFPARPPRISTGSATSPSASGLTAHHPEDLHNPQPPSPYYVDAKADPRVNQNQEVANEAAAALFQTPINTPGDALHLLLEASGRSENLQREGNGIQEHQQTLSSPSMHDNNQSRFTRPGRPASYHKKENIDPAIAASAGAQLLPEAPEFARAVKTWSRLRFVRAGWFTAREAIAYIDYYDEFLAPLTPISPPNFRPSATHPSFLNDEPLLAVTILTIASRYKQLPGPGAESRSYMVHERLWNYLQNMITRMFWGQEQFGGGLCGAGSRKPKSAMKGSLRDLGTIESLLLLSEFHPRSMHFPPGDDGDDILTSLEDESTDAAEKEPYRDPPVFGEATVASWSEPALRSDRMCWSLIGMAHTLAFELGVFGDFHNGVRIPRSGGRNITDLPTVLHEQRVDRIERLLYVYINSACGRFGFPTMHIGPDEDLNPYAIHEQIAARSYASDLVDAIQECWADITLLMKASNANLFPSLNHTQMLIQNGSYVTLLEQFQPTMDMFARKLEAVQLPKHPWIILSIELEYIKMYVNSLALQAVLGHWASNIAPGDEETSSNASFPALYKRNQRYISEVVKAARNLLRLVVDGLLPNNYLKHAPVRTHFRILSGAMFLLKTFALGDKEDEVSVSLQLLDRSIEALRVSVVDDVHLSLRTADLLEGLTSSIRHKFVRLAARNGRSNAPTPPPNSTYPSHSQPSASGPNPYIPSYSATGIPMNSTNPMDNNVSIVPPPNSTYHMNPSPYTNNSSASYDSTLSPFTNNNEEDWLTLDLNPLLSSDSTGFQTGVGNDGQWFGNFGPEINGNLEVLGKLVDGWDTAGMTGF